ncbi:Predicted dehydrogenase [Arthrobacter alpinus]|uniref:Predicted dehydrogenase n=2 Tax=Arthrobacter alpinus TaxID=656366 RepID=A0A1H5PHQ7_9MICC|nr:Predicted dehydrogenase [Arthrobacter alpinus]
MVTPNAAPTVRKPLTVGLIGAGMISHAHARAWQAIGATLLIHAEKGAPEVASRYSIQQVKSYDEILQRVDAVDLATPSYTHKDLALEAIRADKHVICEKPLGLTTADAVHVSNAANNAGVQLHPAHVVRYTAPYLAAHRATQKGRLGKIAVARYFRNVSRPAPESWFRNEDLSGGIIMDLMIHDLDQALWNCGPAESIYAVQNPQTVAGRVPEVTSAHVTIKHEGGAISSIRATWGPLKTRFSTGFSIAGDKGTLSYSSDKDLTITGEIQRSGGANFENPKAPQFESPHLLALREFEQAIRGGPQPRVTARDGIAAVQLVQAARLSLATGQAEEVAANFPVEKFAS